MLWEVGSGSTDVMGNVDTSGDGAVIETVMTGMVGADICTDTNDQGHN